MPRFKKPSTAETVRPSYSDAIKLKNGHIGKQTTLILQKNILFLLALLFQVNKTQQFAKNNKLNKSSYMLNNKKVNTC